MKMTLNIQWFGLSKEALPGILIGMEHPKNSAEISPEIVLSKNYDFAVALDLQSSLKNPLSVVIRDTDVPRLLAWLHTYSDETFPLSQYCRVLTLSDWKLATHESINSINPELLYQWANIISGEIIAQSDFKINLKSIALNRATSCLSYAMARGSIIFSQQPSEIFSLIGSRMLTCDEDTSLHRKKISADSLSKIWFFSNANHKKNDIPNRKIIDIVKSECPVIAEFIEKNTALYSTSAEKRIAGFDQVIDYATSYLISQKSSESPFGLILAAAAFLAGRSTSHVILIEPYAKDYPEAYVWFGLFAGIAGPVSWDRDWMKLCKAVEKMLHAKYSLYEIPQTDISWVEYEWLKNLQNQPTIYPEILKQNTRGLIIEIFPSATCQFKLSLGNIDSYSSNENIISTKNTDVKKESNLNLDMLKQLITDLYSLVNQDKQTTKKQKDLFATETVKITPKKRVTKKHQNKNI